VLGVEAAALPLVAILSPRTAQTPQLYFARPAVSPASSLPGSAEVISTLDVTQGVTTHRLVINGVGTHQFNPLWLFPFLPFGLAKAGTP
jgi:hypothetical protein